MRKAYKNLLITSIISIVLGLIIYATSVQLGANLKFIEKIRTRFDFSIPFNNQSYDNITSHKDAAINILLSRF